MKHQITWLKTTAMSASKVALCLARMEFPLASLGALGLWFMLAKYALGGPLSTDVLGYMVDSLHNVKDTYVLNRQFHILFEKIFLEVAPRPLIGIQYYWAFLIAGTAFLIYICARLFSERSNPVHAILALSIFFSMPPLAESTGIAFVDVTAMFMMGLLTTVYVLSARKKHEQVWLLVLWGGLLYLAFKTKETTLAAWILLFGFAVRDGKLNTKTFLRNLGLVFAGFLAGILVFAIWNSIVLKDFLFGLRLSDIQKFLNTYVKNAQKASPAGLKNWYTGYLFSSLSLPFLFYLIGGFKMSKIDLRLRFVWLMPLMLVLFLTATINNQWGFKHRLFMPALPIIAIVTPQFLMLHASSLKKAIHLIVALLLGVIAIIALRAFLRSMVPHWGWDIVVLMEVVVEPIILTLFLAMAMTETLSTKASVLSAILLLALLITPARRNYKIMFIQRPNWENTQKMFYPYSAFEEELRYVPPMHVYIPLSVWHDTGLSSIIRCLDEALYAYNVYFDANATRSDFYITTSKNPKTFLYDVLGANYTHILLRQKDWQSMQEIVEDDPQAKAWLEQKYEVILEPKNLLVLLKARSP